MSKGGRAIMAMPSTTGKGKVSKIVPFLDPGSAVTTTRNDVNYVITEYGIAQLRGKTSASGRKPSLKSLTPISGTPCGRSTAAASPEPIDSKRKARCIPMTQFVIHPSIWQYDTCQAFAQDFHLGPQDLLLTNEFLYTPTLPP